MYWWNRRWYWSSEWLNGQGDCMIKLLDAVEDRSYSYCYVWMLWKTDLVNIILVWMLYSTDPVVNVLYELFLLTFVRVNICSCWYLLLVVIAIFWLVLLTLLHTHHIVIQLDHTVIYKFTIWRRIVETWWVNYLLINIGSRGKCQNRFHHRSFLSLWAGLTTRRR